MCHADGDQQHRRLVAIVASGIVGGIVTAAQARATCHDGSFAAKATVRNI
jgi:hypothetical protein